MEWSPEKIERFRKAHHLTRKALSELLGVTVNAIYQWERGLRIPSRPTQILLSRVQEELKNKERGERKSGHKRNL